MRNGILVGGNWIIDQVKLIDDYPEQEKLVNILAEYNSNGGSAYNILKDLVKLKADFPLQGLGLVGEDERGDMIINECLELGIDTSLIRKIPGKNTSYTDVMTVKSTGMRTFFHHRGVNALLDIEHFDFSGCNAKIFHLGYLLLLDQLDLMADDGSSRASIVLKSAKEAGFMTSVDVVSEKSDRFRHVIPSSLPFIDYLFVNEFEASMITGMDTTCSSGQAVVDLCYLAAMRILHMGVREWVILHFPGGTIAVGKDLARLFQPSVKLPAEKIAGAVGAGDAFAAGVLLGLHNGKDIEQCLKLGVCAAASSLFAPTSSDGILAEGECLALSKEYGYRNSSQTISI